MFARTSEVLNRKRKFLTASQVPISFIVLTFNEEKNLNTCLGSVAGWAQEIFVVDSGSTDQTLDIARRHGANCFHHAFDSHARQWKWALENLPISTDWVLALDADQSVTDELREEIGQLLQGQRAAHGCYVRRRQIFRGRWIQHGGYYPKYLLKLFRRDAVQIDEGDLVDHHFRVQGHTLKLGADIIEDNQNEADISIWITKHNRYATLQAEEEVQRRAGESARHSVKSLFGTPDQRVLWLKQLWQRLPLFVRPLLYFLYRYFFRLGFLDGKEGFIFHFLQAGWYRLLVDIKIDELQREGVKNQLPRSETAAHEQATGSIKP